MFRVQGTFEEPDIDQGGVIIKDNLGQFWVFGTNEEEALANARTVLKTEEIRVTRVCVFLLPFDVTLYPLFNRMKMFWTPGFHPLFYHSPISNGLHHLIQQILKRISPYL